MKLKKCIMTNSTCYQDQLDKNSYYYWGNHKDKVGIVVHSTGANNPYIKRYVQPSDNDPNYNEIITDIGKNTGRTDWNHKYREAGVHAFIGKNAKDEVETYQVLPYEWGAWGVGRGSKGSYNYAPVPHIQFEICEDSLKDKKYFEAAFKEAIEYCAYLCKQFGWDSSKICSHAESYARGYGGNHADCDHWLKKFGKSMDWFRSEVQKILDGDKVSTETVYIEHMVQSGDNLYNLARKYKTTISVIVDVNNLINPNLIYPGDILKIPTTKVNPPKETVKKTHVVVSGDTLSEIALKYGSSVQEIITANKAAYPRISSNYIVVGWVLQIPV